MTTNKIEALKLFLGLESTEDITETTYNEGCEFETPEGDFLVLTDEEADEKAKESLESFIDECGVTGFSPSFQVEIINHHCDLSWFDEAQKESYEFYIDDIRDENEDEDGNEVTLLQYEIKNAGCETEEDFLDYLCDEDGAEWYKSNFGEEAYNEAVKENCPLNIDAICQACIDWDGRGHTLAGYDGNENEQNFDGTTYYIYRTN